MRQLDHAPPPSLCTLHTPPSWHNRAGRVDRSACLTLLASRLWRWVPLEHWLSHVSNTTRARRQQLPPSQARRLSLARRLDRSATLELDAHTLYQLHRCEEPHQLQGDYRTRKSNAMRVGFGVKADKPHPMKSANLQSQSPEPQTLNPNRGVGFTMHKMLGLPAAWSIHLTIERYFQHAKLKQHFLVCPVCSGGTGFQPVIHSQFNDRQDACPTQPQSPKPNSRHSKLPGGRVAKLYLPLCTRQEYSDAKIAYLWLQTHCHPNRPLSPAAALLIERYAELFPNRSPRCRQCLGLRYGEFKPKQSPKRQRVTQTFSNTQPRTYASCSNPSTPRVAPPLTEQSLFLQNLPKLLARPAPSRRTQPHRRRNPQRQPPANNLPSKIKNLKSNDALLFDLFKLMPSYKTLQKARKLLHLSEHEA